MTEPAQKGKSSKGKYIGAGIAVAVVGAIVILYLSGAFSSGGSPNLGALNTLKPEHKVSLASGVRTVDATKYHYVPFSIPSDASQATVTGRFSASGGSGNDIIVYLFTQDGFVNWQNGHSAENYYNSGKVTTGSINVNVPSGANLVLVFDNTFSLVSDKNVNADIELTYRQ